jgi:hypothetical protein
VAFDLRLYEIKRLFLSPLGISLYFAMRGEFLVGGEPPEQGGVEHCDGISVIKLSGPRRQSAVAHDPVVHDGLG